jgi:hypothetical protein
MGEVELAGIKLESADPRLLDVSQMDLDRHVSMQPSAMAYYGALLKDVGRRLGAMKRHFDRWEKKKYAEAKASLSSGTGKATVADVEARFIVDNESELEKWDKQLDKLQQEHDTLSVWFEAWRQKSFAIREHASITEEERFNESTSIRGNRESSAGAGEISGSRSRIAQVRDIIRKRQGAGALSKGQ